MKDDLFDYDHLFAEALQDAVRGVVRKTLAIAAEHGLSGGHHFHVTFRTDHPGVEIPAELKAQYPDEMTIVLQHMFWDLAVDEDRFAVTLAFNSVRRHLVVPFEAVTIFQDQSVGFALQVDNVQGDRMPDGDGSGEVAGESGARARPPLKAALGASESRQPATRTETTGSDDQGEAGDNVVPLDIFRKN